MGKNLLYITVSLVLLCTPWLGGTGLTLLIAFIPLLALEDKLSGEKNAKGKPKRLWPYIALTFALWWGITTWWVGYAALIGAVLAVVFGAGLTTGAFMIYHAVLKRAPKPLAYTIFVTAWIAYEFFYTYGDISFPWLTLGNGFANSVKCVQWYEYTGVFGGSLWVLVSNLLVYNAIKLRHNITLYVVSALTLLVPITVSLILYYNHDEPQQQVTVTTVQPNIDPYSEKFDTDQSGQTDLIVGLMESAPSDADFIIAPETAINENIWESDVSDSPSVLAIREQIRSAAPNTTVITGATTFNAYTEANRSATARFHQTGGYWYDIYNSALAIDTSRKVDIHHKSLLVAGAEKIPYYSIFKHLEFLVVDLGGPSGQYGVDSVKKIFVSEPTGVKSATAICYESVYGGYFREFVIEGAQIMFVITNDGWWRDTPGYRQHFSFARLRAIETRRSIARSANTGISGFINQRGDVLQTLGWDKHGAITQSLSLNNKKTFYTIFGDYIGRLSCLIFVLSVFYFFSYRVRLRSHLVDPIQ